MKLQACVVLLIFLSMDSVWGSTNLQRVEDASRKWNTLFTTPKVQASIQSSLLEKSSEGINSALSLLQSNPFRWPSHANSTIDYEDMLALEIVYVTSLLFTLVTALMFEYKFKAVQTISVFVFGLTLILLGEMFVIAAMKGDINNTYYNISRILARSPGSIFGVGIAMVWLILPVMELLREHHSVAQRRARFGIACIISLLIAMLTFEPELFYNTNNTMKKAPHYIVFFFLCTAIITQTVLIFNSATDNIFLKIGVAVFVMFIAVGLPIVVIKVQKLELESETFFKWFGAWQLVFICTVIGLWIWAAFLPKSLQAKQQPAPAEKKEQVASSEITATEVTTPVEATTTTEVQNKGADHKDKKSKKAL